MTFTIRDILLLTAFIACFLGWHLDRLRFIDQLTASEERAMLQKAQAAYLQEKLNTLNAQHTSIVNYLIKFDAYRQYISAVAGNYVKEYADVRGMGDLEMEAVAHPDGSRWWYRSIAQKVIGGTVPVNPHCGDESYNHITKTFSVQ